MTLQGQDWNIILLRRYQAKHRSLARRLARTSSPSSSWHLHSSSSSIFQQLPELSFENVQMIAPSVRTLVSLDPVKCQGIACMLKGDWVETLKILWGRGVTVSHCMCTHVCVHTCVSIQRDIEIHRLYSDLCCVRDASVFVCKCISILICCIEWNCVDPGDALCFYISAVARRTHLSYTSDSTFVFFALKHLSPIRQNFRN